MDKNKHMDIYARLTIQGCLDNGKSFKAIGKETGKDCTTIAKEVKNHFICERKGAYGRSFCDCVHYTETCRKRTARRIARIIGSMTVLYFQSRPTSATTAKARANVLWKSISMMLWPLRRNTRLSSPSAVRDST